jgi:hypothetical protein
VVVIAQAEKLSAEHQIALEVERTRELALHERRDVLLTSVKEREVERRHLEDKR